MNIIKINQIFTQVFLVVNNRERCLVGKVRQQYNLPIWLPNSCLYITRTKQKHGIPTKNVSNLQEAFPILVSLSLYTRIIKLIRYLTLCRYKKYYFCFHSNRFSYTIASDVSIEVDTKRKHIKRSQRERKSKYRKEKLLIRSVLHYFTA